VENDEALHPAAADEQVDVVARSGRSAGFVVAGNRTAQDDPAAHRELTEADVEQFPADVVEVEIDAVWADGLETRGDVRLFVVDRGVEPEFVDEPRALRCASGDANDTRGALDAGDLSHRRPGRSGGARNDDGVALLDAPNVEQAEV